MKLKRIISALAVLVMTLSVPVFGQDGSNIRMNNNLVDFKTPPIIENNKILISLKDINDQFGINVENDGTTFTCKSRDKYISFKIDERVANANGKNIMLETSVKSGDEDIFVPLREVFENLNYNIDWDQVTKSMNITLNKDETDDIMIKEIGDIKVPHAKHIAHAGGKINGQVLTNSKEAIENSYRKGHSLIELDMQWSTDGELVLLHDWGNFSRFINSPKIKRYSAEEFKSFKMNGNLTPMTLDELVDWLDNNLDVYIVTDIKINNLGALRLIKDKYPEIQNRFIPQIYDFGQYDAVDKMGYKNIIMTMYDSNYNDRQILDFVENNNVFAITMPQNRAKTNLPTLLKDQETFTYTHTINTEEIVEDLKKYNIRGFYSDVLMPYK